MKSLLILLFTVVTLSGCGSFWRGGAVGAATGVVGAGATYEYRLNQEKERIKADLDAGRITQQEYDIRLDQIRRDSIID